MVIDEKYIEKLCNEVARIITEAIENLTIEDVNMYLVGYNKAVEEFRAYLKTVEPCEMPQDVWNMGVDNTCDRMLKK